MEPLHSIKLYNSSSIKDFEIFSHLQDTFFVLSDFVPLKYLCTYSSMKLTSYQLKTPKMGYKKINFSQIEYKLFLGIHLL